MICRIIQCKNCLYQTPRKRKEKKKMQNLCWVKKGTFSLSSLKYESEGFVEIGHCNFSNRMYARWIKTGLKQSKRIWPYVLWHSSAPAFVLKWCLWQFLMSVANFRNKKSNLKNGMKIPIPTKIKLTSSWDYGTYHIGDQRWLRRACAYAQSRQSLRCSHTWSIEVDKGSIQKADI